MQATHGLDALPPEVTSLVIDSRLPRPGQPSSGSYEGDGYITVRHPDTAVVTDALRAAGHHRARGTGLIGVNVLMISPGYPLEMAFFTRAARPGGRDRDRPGRPVAAGASWPPPTRPWTHYVQVGSLADEDAVAATVRELARQVRFDRVECLWEPYMVLAARLREELGLPG